MFEKLMDKVQALVKIALKEKAIASGKVIYKGNYDCRF